MALFTTKARTNVKPYRQRETRYQYLDKSARPECEAIRRLITRWLDDYPKINRDEWISRFSSEDDIAYSSSFFELYIYTYFIRSGFDVEVAPGSQGGQVRAPDFKIQQGKLRFFLEATTAHDKSAGSKQVSRWKTIVRNHIDAIENEEFFASLEWLSPPTMQPVPTEIARIVSAWLSSLNYTMLHENRNEQHFEPPLMDAEVMGGRIRVLAFPKSRRKRTDGLLGGECFGLQEIDIQSSLRNALKQKSSRYGDLGAPYIVAINVHADTADHEDFLNALYGASEVVVHRDGRYQWRYGYEGGFGHQGRPRARRVSAALCVRDISPWTIGQEHNDRRMCLIHHPHGEFPIDHNVFSIDGYWAEGEQVMRTMGRYARKVLGIPRDWPDMRR